jgi:rhamnosyltransferase subunit B
MKRFLLVALGSLGDLHPFMAVGHALQTMGHWVGIASFTDYQQRITQAGFTFYPVHTGGLSVTHSQTVAYVMDLKKGGQRLMTEFVFPYIQSQYADVMAATQQAQPHALFSSELAYATPLLSELTGIPWFSGTLQPLAFWSDYDAPLLPGIPAWLTQHALPCVKAGASWQCNRWAKPWHLLRQQLGLPPTGEPVIQHKWSKHGVLALFDAAFAPHQPDWPTQTVQTGFAFLPQQPPTQAVQAAMAFCQQGSPPLVVTLGSAAVHAGHGFYATLFAVLQQHGHRALVLTGQNTVPNPLPEHIHTIAYAPHEQVFPFGRLIVHQGGVGTTAQALRAGVPSLVVPFSHDQPDNAHRLDKLGVGQVLPRQKVTTHSLAAALALPMAAQQTRARALQAFIGLQGADHAAQQLGAWV